MTFDLPHVKQHVFQTLSRYLTRFPSETNRQQRLVAELADPMNNPFVRGNMRGHVTTSVVVLDSTRSQVLMIDHLFLKKWLPPGGHYEPPESLWQAALREVEEETGVTGLTPLFIEEGDVVPLDIDSHTVPENPAKAEGPHWHHDFRFIAVASEAVELVPQLEEVHAAKWMPVAEFIDIYTQRRSPLADKVKGALDELACAS